MDTGKNIIEKQRRTARSKTISLKFYTKNHFKVYDGKKVKYIGHIPDEGIFDSCSCPSFYFGMKYAKPEDQTVPFTSLYFAEHGHTFQCKHIIAAIAKNDKKGNCGCMCHNFNDKSICMSCDCDPRLENVKVNCLRPEDLMAEKEKMDK